MDGWMDGERYLGIGIFTRNELRYVSLVGFMIMMLFTLLVGPTLCSALGLFHSIHGCSICPQPLLVVWYGLVFFSQSKQYMSSCTLQLLDFLLYSCSSSCRSLEKSRLHCQDQGQLHSHTYL